MRSDHITKDPFPLKYTECDWGDLIEGTKEQLQALGIGVARTFPGEPGGPRFDLRTRDHRGYPVKISRKWHNDNRFSCFVVFPHWPKRPEGQWKQSSRGVMMRQLTWYDEYVGSADDLAAAGLVPLDHLPGKPGMRKMRVTILPDGGVLGPATHSNNSHARSPGARMIEIESASKASYRVLIVVNTDEVQRRQAADQAAELAWRQTVRALPRPARLDLISRPTMAHARSHLRLVWVRPA